MTLFQAIAKQDLAEVKKALATGANVNATDSHGQSALMHAAASNNPAVLQVLIAAGADVNAKNEDDETALALTEDDEIKKMLEAAGAIDQGAPK